MWHAACACGMWHAACGTRYRGTRHTAPRWNGKRHAAYGGRTHTHTCTPHTHAHPRAHAQMRACTHAHGRACTHTHLPAPPKKFRNARTQNRVLPNNVMKQCPVWHMHTSVCIQEYYSHNSRGNHSSTRQLRQQRICRDGIYLHDDAPDHQAH